MPRYSWVAGLLFSLVACGSPPPLPAAEYFPAVEVELARLDQATRDLTDRYAMELEAEVEALVAAGDPEEAAANDRLVTDVIAVAATKMQAIIESHTGQVEGFAARIDELVPPDVVRDQHSDLIEAFRSWARSGEETVPRLDTAADVNGLARALQQSPYADAQLRVDEACRGLLEEAAVFGVALSCPGTELRALEVGS